MWRRSFARSFVVLSLLTPTAALAHHGVASLGTAGLEGPGAPLETSSSATLPRGGVLLYNKVDYADFKRYSPWQDDESTYNLFVIFGLGYGIRSWLSAYVFLPYSRKIVEDGSSDSSGLADMSLMGVLGFKYDEGFQLTPDDESLDDLEDWHFTFYGGLTVPTGSGERATGGDILYLLPGIRAYWRNTSLGIGVKLPTWKKLNEESEQQGAEGKEEYRLICSFSLLF